MSESSEELSPEQEELAKKFAAELEGVSGIELNSPDEDGQLWLTMGDMAVPVTPEEAAVFSQAVYDSALARVRAMAPPPPKPTRPEVRLFAWTITLGFAGTVAWALARLFGIL